MSPPRADVQWSALPELSAELRVYVQRVQQGQAEAERGIQAVERRVRSAIDQARHGLSTASQALSEVEGRDEVVEVQPFRHRVVRARFRLAELEAIESQTRSLTCGYRPAAARFASIADLLSRDARQTIARAEDALDAYRAVGGRGGAVRAASTPSVQSGGSGGRPSPSALPGFPSDIVMVPLGMIRDSDPVVGPQDFSGDYSSSKLEWSHEAFSKVVAPGVGRGLTIEDFRARDAAEGRVGTASYANTYDGFFGSDAIVLGRVGDSFDVANGRHRIWVARQMGLAAVPARLVGEPR